MTTTSASCAYETIPFLFCFLGQGENWRGVKKDVLGRPNTPQKNLVWDTVHVFFSDAMTTLLQQFPVTVILFLHQNSSKFLLLNQIKILLIWAHLFDFILQVKRPCLSFRRQRECAFGSSNPFISQGQKFEPSKDLLYQFPSAPSWPRNSFLQVMISSTFVSEEI